MKYTIMPTSTSPYSTTSRPPRRPRFNANDPKYRCCCGRSCHVRTGTMFVGAAEIIMIGLFMIGSCVWFVYDGYRRAHERRYGLNRARLYDHNEFAAATVTPEPRYEDPDAPSFVCDQWSIIWLGVCLLSGLLFLITIGLLFLGVVRERRGWLIPHMIMQALFLLAFAALLVYSAVFAVLAADSLFSSNSDQQQGGSAVMSGVDDHRRARTINRLVLYCLQAGACLFAMAVFGVFFTIVYRYYNYLRDYTVYEKKNRQAIVVGSASPGSTTNSYQTIKLLQA